MNQVWSSLMFFKTIASRSDRGRGMGLNEGNPRSPLTKRGECVRYESLEVTEENALPSKFCQGKGTSGKVYK